MPTDTEQATFQSSGEHTVDEYGDNDEWERGGVYDESGEFDLAATKSLLADRFAPVDARLPESVNGYTREHTDRDYTARYQWTGETENQNGLRVTEREVRIFPRGPHLHEWCVEVRELTPELANQSASGWASWLHPHAQCLETPAAAATTALAVMCEQISPR